jgi:hypothetical protein
MRKREGKERKEGESDYEEDKSNNKDSSDDSSAYQYMDATSEKEEDEDLSPDFMKKCIHLNWDCITHGVSLAALDFPFAKPYIYKLKEDLEMLEIHNIMLREWKVTLYVPCFSTNTKL